MTEAEILHAIRVPAAALVPYQKLPCLPFDKAAAKERAAHWPKSDTHAVLVVAPGCWSSARLAEKVANE